MMLAPPAAEARADGLPPLLLLPPELRLTLEQFTLVCAVNPEAVLELAADGRLIPMPPTDGDTGARNHSLSLALGLAARACADPLKLFDSSTGFRLPDGSVLSPDASAVRLECWQALTPEQRRGVPPLCPDPVVAGSAYRATQGPSLVIVLRPLHTMRWRASRATLPPIGRRDHCVRPPSSPGTGLERPERRQGGSSPG